jgi:radical SAM protein (TIGR01212 family)
MSPNRFYPLSVYFRRRFGCRVRKIPLDAGSSCPNRDGFISAGGCTFCNEKGSGTGLAETQSLREQFLAARERMLLRGTDVRFMGYIQSFSNTYGPAGRLRGMMQELAGLPDLTGIAVGTRPDCLDREKLAILRDAPFEEVWLDLGLQSANDSTLLRINRGHDAACFIKWAQKAGDSGVKVCAHVITGLPGETLADFEQTLAVVNSLPVSGIKIHNLYICRGTAMERQWRAGEVELLSQSESLAWLVRGLALLRPDIVVHRLNADPDADELAAPGWALDKTQYLNSVKQCLQESDGWQGKALGMPLSDWFNLDGRENT